MFTTGPKYSSTPRFVQLLSLIIGVFVMGSCKDQPPTAPLRAPSSASFSSGANQSWVRSSFFIDNTTFVPCLGEQVRVFGEVPFQYHEVTSSSGGFNFHLQLRPLTPKTPQFYIQVISSGKLYSYSNGLPINESFHLAAGEVHSLHDKERFIAEDGSKLFFTFILHTTVNANGVLTVSRVQFEDLNCG